MVDEKIINMMRDVVLIDADEYKELVQLAGRYNTLTSMLFDAAVLSFDGKTLDFRNESIAAYLNAVEYDAYSNVISRLKEEKC